MSARLELNLKAKPKATIAAGAALSGAFLPLQVGKRYVLKNGMVTGITEPHTDGVLLRVPLPDAMWVSYWKDSGRYIWAVDDSRNVVGEYVELSPFDKMVQDWLNGKNIRYRAAAAHHWSNFPRAAAIGGDPVKFIKGYEKQMEWEALL